MLHSRSRSNFKNYARFVIALAGLALAVAWSPSGAQTVMVNLDGIEMNANESSVDTQVTGSYPACVVNTITNNTAQGYTFDWPAAGPGGFTSKLLSGPGVGTKWEWDTGGAVWPLFLPIEFKPAPALPVFGFPSTGIQNINNNTSFIVGGVGTQQGQLLSVESLGGSLITFFSPPQSQASCAASFSPGSGSQILTNDSPETITITLIEDDCCLQADQVLCEDGCKDYFEDPSNCGGCGIDCGDGDCNFGCCTGTSNCSGICADLQNDPLNCGQCGSPCLESEICGFGVCSPFCNEPAGETFCGEGICADLLSDEDNCGICGNACDPGYACEEGTCELQCFGGEVDCGGVCTDLDNDPNNCASCGNVCDFSECPTGTGFCGGGEIGCECDPVCVGATVAQLPAVVKDNGQFCPTPAQPSSVCDCPPGYVAVGYEGEQGNGWGVAVLSQFSLRCRNFLSDGTLGGSLIVTCSNGTASGDNGAGPVDAAGDQAMVGAQLRVGCALDRLAGASKPLTEVLAGEPNSISSGMTALGGTGGSPRPAQFAPDGTVFVGMQTYAAGDGITNGVAWRYAPIGGDCGGDGGDSVDEEDLASTTESQGFPFYESTDAVQESVRSNGRARSEARSRTDARGDERSFRTSSRRGAVDYTPTRRVLGSSPHLNTDARPIAFSQGPLPTRDGSGSTSFVSNESRLPADPISVRRAGRRGTNLQKIDRGEFAVTPAGPVTVPNVSFESPSPAPQTTVTGWTTNDAGGVDPSSFGFPAAADGVQNLYLNLTGFGGTSPNSADSNPGLIGAAQVGTYTLTVAGGRRADGNTTDGSYDVELLAGGVVIGSQTVFDPLAAYAPGSWNDITAVAVVNPGDPAVGQDLTIRLSASNGKLATQGQFDNVRLNFEPPPSGEVECSLIDFESIAHGELVGTIEGMPNVTFGPSWTALKDFDASPSGNCCDSENGGLGCADPVCEASVCAGSPDCCGLIWDQTCSDLAFDDPNCTCYSGNIANEPSPDTVVTYFGVGAIFNSETPAENAATKQEWLDAIGILEAEITHTVDFETGFTNGQNVSGATELFPEGMIIWDTSGANEAIVTSGAGSIGDSNPVGTFALRHNQAPWLEIDFQAWPVDYFAFQDIDNPGADIRVWYEDFSTDDFTIEPTGASGDSAEFFGVFRNTRRQIIYAAIETVGSADNTWAIDNILYGRGGVIPEESIDFDEGVQFVEAQYSAASISLPVTLTAWDGPGGTGNVIDTVVGNTVGLNFGDDQADCTGDPTGNFCLWSQLQLTSASDDIRSVTIEGSAANAFGFDNMQFCTGVPETGACCLGENDCQVTTADNCGSQGGAYQGDDAQCLVGTCGPPFIVGIDPAGICSATQIVEVPVEPGETETICIPAPNQRAGLEVRTTASIRDLDGDEVATGPCAQIVGTEQDWSGFIPTVTKVLIDDASGDFLPQPGESFSMEVEVLNVGEDPYTSPTAVLSSPTNFINPTVVEFGPEGEPPADTSTYPTFVALLDSDLASCGPPVQEANLSPVFNQQTYQVVLNEFETGGGTRMFKLTFDGFLPGPTAFSTDLDIPLGIGRPCDPSSTSGPPFDGLDGFLGGPQLVPRRYPLDYTFPTYTVGDVIPLDIVLRCGANPSALAKLDPLPAISKIDHDSIPDPPLPLIGINADIIDPDNPAFLCTATGCSFNLDTQSIPPGNIEVEIRMTDGRKYKAGFTIVP